MVYGAFAAICTFFFLISSADNVKESYYQILGVPFDASDAEIKRSYRKLALDYHPDKLNSSDVLSQMNEIQAREKFLKIQEAYEVLHDAERRLQYDMGLKGVQYDILSQHDFDRFSAARYMMKPFQMFVKSKRFKLHFVAAFKPPKVPDLVIQIDVDPRMSMTGLKMAHLFYRRERCPSCSGTGGLNSQCQVCPQCLGKGVAWHLYRHACGADQMTETICAACGGRGCFVHEKCPVCNGSGMKMTAASVLVVLGKGFKNKSQLSLAEQGHHYLDGRVSDVVATCVYNIAANWTLDDTTGDLTVELTTTLQAVLKGFTVELATPMEEKVNVTVQPVDLDMSHFSEGVTVRIEGRGLRISPSESSDNTPTSSEPEDEDEDYEINASSRLAQRLEEEKSEEEVDEDGDRVVRGAVVVHYVIDWSDVSIEGLKELLKDAGWDDSDPLFRRILKLFAATRRASMVDDNADLNVDDVHDDDDDGERRSQRRKFGSVDAEDISFIQLT